jgi:hypothetical protein
VGNSCYVRNHVHTAIVVVIVGNYFIIACNFLGVVGRYKMWMGQGGGSS